MEFKVKDIAMILNGTVEGDGEIKIHNISKIDQGVPGTLTFLSNPAYTKYIYSTLASAVIVSREFVPEGALSCTLIRVNDPYTALAELLKMYQQMKPAKSRIEQPSFVSNSATIGEDIYIGAFAYISDSVTIGNNVSIYPHVYIGDNVVIGDNTTIYAGVKIYADCKIGSDCILHSGAVIGADGFGFAPNANGPFSKILQVGNVILEDMVEIGANTCVDRATMGSTIIHSGVKLDNLIQVAHNVEIGENTVIAGQAGVAGSSKVGKNCMIGAQVGISGHLTVGDNVKIGGQAGVMSNIANDSTIIGSPVQDHKDFMRCMAIFRRLPQMSGDISDLKKWMKQSDSK
ncbi:MAG: UDP-3-O-(3-hydroxymyristoyl)glucosamine N-acyltransferase [Prolixibacteraceae bacterium]|nr:UDP-3-O-(3-hydroxymyristoyl)glucosamine N-acyltransferase [Prolixibacteraceae bacterium]